MATGSKLWGILALSAALATAPAAAAEAAEWPPTPRASETDETPVEIPDAALRRAVEVALGKASGAPITRGEMETLRNLSAKGVRQLAGIEHAINLRWLSSYGGAISELAPLADLTSLTYLSLPGHAIADVSALSGLTALTQLFLFNNAIADVSPLAGLTALTHLHLGGNEIADVSPLAGMTSLTLLVLRGSFAEVIREDGFEYLVLASPGIADVSPLAGLSSLVSLDLAGNSIRDLSPLTGLQSLTHLDIGFNEVEALTAIADLRSLTSLDLWHNRITDLSPLAGLQSLTTLSLFATGAKSPLRLPLDLSPLADLTSLTRLVLHANRLRDLSPLSGLTSLEHLGLQSNNISDLSALAGLTSLNHLELYNNLELWDLSPLGGLSSLVTLQIGYCGSQLRDMSPLAGLTSLQTLNLPGNGIVDLSPFASLTSLRRLLLRGNNIVDVSPLASLNSLEYLGLAESAIADLSPLLDNAGLGDGDVLVLNGNPLGKMSVESVIPQLLERGVEVSFELPELPEGWEPIEIADAGLRAALERRLSKGEGWWIAKEEIARLSGLVLSHAGVRDLSGVQVAEGLLRLDASGNAIVDLAPLADTRQLRMLFLDSNDLEDIRHLAGLPLLALTLSDNAIEDVAPLAALLDLRYLALDGNALRDVPLLPASLRHLHLTNNELSDIAALADLQLDELRLSGNAIASLAPLAGQPLRYLHFNGNRVTDLTPLNIASLLELHAKDNALRDISPLLDGEALSVVDVRGNPLAQDAIGVVEALRERDTTVLAGETVPYFPAAGGARQGFVRVVNHSDEAGHAFVEAVDDAGVRAGPARLELEASQAVHFNSTDLEYGNAAKGLEGIGAPTSGDWRLSVVSALDAEVLSYIRTEDGFVTAMHDVAADAMAPFFNPGSNRNQRSVLRVVNTEAEPAKWTTGGYDDRGKWHPMAGSLLVRPQHALTLTAQELEDAHGLGDGRGKWRLRVRGFPWFAMSLLESPTGHLTNLSTAPAHATPLADGAALHRLPLFPAAGGAREGFARLINRSYSSGQVTIEAIDDAGTRSGPVRLTMRPRQAVHFNSMDLEGGNAAKGLVGSVGVGEGDWRLEITSELDLMVLAYARTPDGFLTSLHDLAPVAEDGSHRVVFFNPGSNTRQVSQLRLINDGERGARVTITGIDDQGNGSGHVVGMVPAGSALTFTAAELETGGERVAGSLGDGERKWRLRVRSDEAIAVMSLLTLPTGHMTNLSTTPR